MPAVERLAPYLFGLLRFDLLLKELLLRRHCAEVRKNVVVVTK
jgi:hypothetical protein